MTVTRPVGDFFRKDYYGALANRNHLYGKSAILTNLQLQKN
jgi:regulation of enolase protein 1 (concanavalin A-like superfamily)